VTGREHLEELGIGRMLKMHLYETMYGSAGWIQLGYDSPVVDLLWIQMNPPAKTFLIRCATVSFLRSTLLH